MSKSTGLKLVYGSLVALLLTFSATAAFAQDQFQESAPQATATIAQPTDAPTATPVPPVATNTPVSVPPTPVPTPTPTTPTTPPVQIPEPITVVLFGTGLAALSASVSKRRKNQ